MQIDPKKDKNEKEESRLKLPEMQKRWQDFIERISQVKMSVATYLTDATIEDFQNNVLTLSFFNDQTFSKEVLEQKKNRSIIEDILSEMFNAKIRINFL